MSLFKVPENVKSSKEALDRQKACIFVISIFLLQGPRVAAALAELFNPTMEGEEPGFLPMIQGFARALKATIAKLVEADEIHYRVKADQANLVRKRDRATDRASRRVVGLRRTVLGQHEGPDLGKLGFEGESARESMPVLRQVDRISEIFDQGELDDMLGPPIFEGNGFDPKDLGTQLKKDGDELRLLMNQVGDSKARLDDAFMNKQKAQDAHDELFLRTARIFEDSCRLIGEIELAKRVRPSKRRRGRTEIPPDEVPEEALDDASGKVGQEAAAADTATGQPEISASATAGTETVDPTPVAEPSAAAESAASDAG